MERLRRIRIDTSTSWININYKGKNNNFTAKKLSRHHVNQMIKVNIISNKIT